jgi:predicted nucleic acid-binding protein
MNLFFDTSSLFKLYHKEEGTKELIDFFRSNQIDAIFLSEITGIEFSSAVWKKCRNMEISEEIANLLIEKFELDSANYRFVKQNDKTIMLAKNLIGKHWRTGLRTLDSVQLASVLIIKNDIDLFFTSDMILSEVATIEGLKVKN